MEAEAASTSCRATGGTACWVRGWLQTGSATRPMKGGPIIPCSGGRGRWAAQVVRLRGLTILLISVYLIPVERLSEANLAVLHEIRTYIDAMGFPFIAIGDWNLEPREFHDITWLRDLRAVILPPKGAGIICTMGKGSLLDWAVASTMRDVRWWCGRNMEMEMEMRWR